MNGTSLERIGVSSAPIERQIAGFRRYYPRKRRAETLRLTRPVEPATVSCRQSLHDLGFGWKTVVARRVSLNRATSDETCLSSPVMSPSTAVPDGFTDPAALAPSPRVADPRPSAAVDELHRWFGVEFSLFDESTGDVVHASTSAPIGDRDVCGALARAAAHSGTPEFVGDEDGVLLLALVYPCDETTNWIAVAPMVVREPSVEGSVAGAATLIGRGEVETRKWISVQTVWTPDALLRLAAVVSEKRAADVKNDRLEQEIDNVSANLACTYEEISLIYGVTQNLSLSASDEDLGQLALDWLSDCMPVEGIGLLLLPVADETATYQARTDTKLFTAGDCPLTEASVLDVVHRLELTAAGGPKVANRGVTGSADWKYPEIRQLIMTPLAEGQNLFGWLIAVNHKHDRELGTVEATLLNTVATILGIHGGNHELYRQQREFLASVVRALTSAIDAKDPYTCGHSDRVARISVRLGRELGCDDEFLNTLYMAGLLHDIGKIGIDDSVLRKPGRLTDEEFEHIKMHPELGYRILRDLKQLDDTLPVVLHHHENWDGKGYPHGLAGTAIPFEARIAAVADAYDAMTSDRPYRKGMPLEKVERIFEEGSGRQWDPQVVAAYFAVKEEISGLSEQERGNLTLDVQQWVRN